MVIAADLQEASLPRPRPECLPHHRARERGRRGDVLGSYRTFAAL